MKYLLVLLLFITGCGSYSLKENKSYDSGVSGLYDVYEPRTWNGRSIIYIHGGALMMGDKGEAKTFAELVCPLGYRVYSPNYHLTIDGSAWPTQINDTLKFQKYVFENLKDKSLIMAGSSAGATLAVQTTLRGISDDNYITNKVINISGWHDLTLTKSMCFSDYDRIVELMFKTTIPLTDQLNSASSITFARNDINILTIHGQRDQNVFIFQADSLKNQLARFKNIKHSYIVWTDARAKLHGKDCIEAGFTEITDYLKRN